MIFGKSDQFAIEAVLEPGPEFGPVQGNNLVGRIRVWLRGKSIGDFDEPACWLGPPASDFVEQLAQVDRLWDPALEGLRPDSVFAQLDQWYFGESEITTAPDASKAGGAPGEVHRFVFLTNWSESFDGWKAFLVRISESELMALVLADGSVTISVFRVPVQIYREAVQTFAQWLSDQERVLLPHLDRQK